MLAIDLLMFDEPPELDTVAVPFTLDAADKLNSAADVESIMTSKVSSLVFSTLATTDYPFIQFKDITLNRMLEYFMRDTLVASDILQQMIIEDQYQLTVYVPYFTMSDSLIVNVPVLIENLSDPEMSFPTTIKIAATPEIDGNDLKIVLNELSAGEITLSEEYIENILSS